MAVKFKFIKLKLTMYFLLIVIALIVHGSLYPWHFAQPPSGTNPFVVLLNSWPQQFDSLTGRDAIINLAFYFPLGLLAFLHASRRCGRSTAALVALCAGGLLSTALELIQVYAPSRVCSTFDILCNVGGTAAGVLTALAFQKTLVRAGDSLAHRFLRPVSGPCILLLSCWAGYQLFPFAPQFRPLSLPWEFVFLRHPDNLFPAEICVNIAEWFSVALIVRHLLGRFRIWWFVALVALRFVLRVFLLTRGFALDELIGVALALLLWVALPERRRLRTGLVTMACVILLRQLSPFPFSQLPSYLGSGGVILRRCFDYGVLVWILGCIGVSRIRAGAVVIASLIAVVAAQLLLPGRSPSFSPPLLALLVTLGIWFAETSPKIRQGGIL